MVKLQVGSRAAIGASTVLSPQNGSQMIGIVITIYTTLSAAASTALSLVALLDFMIVTKLHE